MAGEEEVQVVESCLVSPAGDTPRKALWLSPLDLMLANRGITPAVRFYQRGAANNGVFFDVTKLKTALSKALVAFYPLAGRLSVDADGRLEVDCNRKGMLFVVAHSRLSIDNFSDFKPSPRLRRLFVPHIDDSTGLLCATQVTFMRCGGVVLGTATHHGVADGTAVLQFLRTWAAFSKDGSLAVVNLPCHDRTLLQARDPPVVHPDTLSIFCPKMILSKAPGPAVVNEVFTIRKDQVSTLKRMCGGDGVSAFSAVTALVWQCMCLSRGLPPSSTTRLTFLANVRRAAMAPPLPSGYFGNAVINVAVADDSPRIALGDLAYVAARIRGTLAGVNDELVRSAVDYLELAASAERVDSRPAVGNLPATDVRVVSWLGIPFHDLDFGWGKPVAMLPAESNRGGFVYLMDGGAQGDGIGSVRLVVCLEAAVLMEFKRLLYAKLDNIVYSKF